MNKKKIRPRREWGAKPPTGSRTPHVPREIVIHHSVYPMLPAYATPKQEGARMREVQALHQGKGWIDFAYHLYIFASGRVYRGRPLRTVGSHVEGANTGRVGICFDGDFTSRLPTPNAMNTLHYLLDNHPTLKSLPVKAHRDFGGTSCPGDRLYRKVREL